MQVNERVLYFNETYTNGFIDTFPTFNNDTVYFKATIFPDASNKDRFFTGHSFGSLKGEKALEKLETVAVGRALAFMGIGIVEGIASADEMAKFHNNNPAPKTFIGPAQNSLIKPGACNICGSIAMQAKSGNFYCPSYKSHGPFKIIATPTKLPDKLQKFSDDLDNIPII